MNPAKLTILMPLKSYHPDFLEQSLASVVHQTCPRWELIIVVERSDSGKFRKLLAQTLEDDRVRLVINRGRKLAGAFNTGMREAATEFTAILLADDLWAPQAVEVLERAIERNPEADFFHSSRRIVDENGESISSVHLCRNHVTLEDFRSGTPVKHLLCWRRELAIAIGGMDESLNSVGPDDFDFPWLMAEHGARFHPVPECLYIYREHDECFRLTTGLPLSVHKQEIQRILRKHGLSEEEIRTWVEKAQRSFLRQCMYNSRLDRLWDKVTGGRRKQGFRPEFE
jgi:glycosyltransferase EpsE